MSSDSNKAIEKALASIVQARQAKSDLVDQVSAGSISFKTVFELSKSDPLIARVKLTPLLDSIPGRTKIAIRRFLRQADIDEFVKLEELTLSESERVLEEFSE